MGELAGLRETLAFVLSVCAIIVAALAYRETRAQTGLIAAAGLSAWTRDMRKSSDEVVDALTAASASGVTASTEGSQQEHLVRIAALIDRGRLLLPNHPDHSLKHDHKPPAFRGLRHGALDALVAAHRVLRGELPLENLPDHKAALIGLRREFVSDVQRIVNPRAANRQIAKLLNRAYSERTADPTVGGLLPNLSKRPKGAAATLAIVQERYRVEAW